MSRRTTRQKSKKAKEKYKYVDGSVSKEGCHQAETKFEEVFFETSEGLKARYCPFFLLVKALWAA
jgi:hypothetical protein